MMRTFTIAFLAVAFISCNTTNGERPYKSDNIIFKNPYITGEITHIDLKRVGTDSLYKVLVEENPAVDEPLEEGGEKINLTLWESTEIFTLKNDGNIYFTTKENLKVGQKVKAWLMSGDILTSYPSQGGAKRILLVEE